MAGSPVPRACGRATRGPGRAGGRPRACRRRSPGGRGGCAGARSRATAARRSSPSASASLGSTIRPGGKSSGVRIGSVAEDDGAFQGVVELADVARPGGGHQARGSWRCPRRRRACPGVRACLARSTATSSGMSSRRSRSGGRWIDDDVEPVVQVGAEPAGGDLGGQVLVRRRHQPGLERHRAGRADGQDLLVLDGPEQLRLGRPATARRSRRGRPCPRPAATNRPGVVAVGAGEGAPDVAEELVLQQVVRDRRAVDGQEQAPRGRARARAGPGPPAPCRCPTRR